MMKKTPTLYEIMGEDMGITASMNKDGDAVHVQVHDEEGKCVYDEESHRYAWDSLVSFSRQVLHYDKWFKDFEKIKEEVEEDEGFKHKSKNKCRTTRKRAFIGSKQDYQ